MELKTLNEISTLWQRVLTNIQTEVDAMIFNSFFKDSYIHSVQGDKLIVACNSNLSVSILNQQYLDLTTSITNKLTGTNFKIIFTSPEEIKNTPLSQIEAVNDSVFFKGCSLDPNFNFDNFVVGPSNKEASQAGLIVASSPGKFYNPLFIYGDSGLGKTHLLNAIGNYIKDRNPSMRILYVTAQEFLYQYIDYVNGVDHNEQLSKYIKNYDVFLIDDIQMLKDKVKTLEFFFDIYQYFIQNKKQIVLTSDKLPSELNGIDARLVSRFMDGLTVQINKPSVEMCENILKKKIVGANLSIDEFDPEVINFIADKFKNSIRELNGALNRIIFIKNMEHAPRITMDLTYEALSNLINVKDSKNKITEQKILNTVATYYSLSVNQITGKLRVSQIATARHISIYLIRKLIPNISLDKIGETFSNRDHATIIHSVSKVEDLLKTDQQTKQAVEDIKSRLNGLVK